MKKRMLLLLTCCLSAVLCYGQTGTVSGRVTDSSDGQPLIGVTVLVSGTSKGTITDLDGNYSLKGIPAGSQSISFSYIGYKNLKKEISVTQGNNTDMGEIALETNTIALKEVEVFADLVDDRKTPIAVSAIGSQEIQERYAGLELPEMLNSTPGVYTNQGAGGFGDNEIYIRGFDQTNVAFMINGIPVNDMENGSMYWSNFAGISEATRQMQVQRGLGASKLAINSIGGTVNMISKPAEKSEGGRLEYQMGNSTWNQRIRFTYNTGELDGGWAVSFQGSRTSTNGLLAGLSGSEQGGYRPGAFVDAWSYYLAVSKKINDRHQLLFYGFGAPVNRGTAWNFGEQDKENFNITNNFFNFAAGYYRGEFFNGRQNKIHKPQFSLSHYWDINRTTSLATSVYFSYANVYSTQPRGGHNNTRTSEGYIDWDALAAQNLAQDPITINNPNGDPYADPVTGRAALNYLEARFNNHNWVGMISTFKKSIQNFNFMLGVDLRDYRGKHYAEAFELLGADFVQNSFGANSNNLLTPNSVARKGDRINYDYDGNVLWGATFGQIEYSKNKVNAFFTATGTRTTMWRVGNFWSQQYQDNSLGKSEEATFNTFTIKSGASYSFTGRHKAYANVGYYTRPPYLRNAFADARYSNQYVLNLSEEKITAFEVGYSFRASFLKFNINFYNTDWRDRSVGITVDDPASQETRFSAVSGLDSKHRGVELDLTWNATSSLEINGFFSYGDWNWVSNARAQVPFFDLEGNPILVERTIFADGLPIGNSAQTMAGLGFHYTGIRDTYIGGRMNFADRLYIQHDPADEFTATPSPEQLPSYQVFDLYFGRYFDISEDVRARLSGNINNVFDAEYVRWATRFSNQVQNGYGFGTTYNIGLTLYF